jgi:hypothetical protein
MNPDRVKEIIERIKCGRRNMYPYLEWDTPSGDPDACLDICRESDGEWVRYDAVIDALYGNPEKQP